MENPEMFDEEVHSLTATVCTSETHHLYDVMVYGVPYL
jgi:hypothetical protein